jgi:hypothetical protein
MNHLRNLGQPAVAGVISCSSIVAREIRRTIAGRNRFPRLRTNVLPLRRGWGDAYLLTVLSSLIANTGLLQLGKEGGR